jgi:hypothetical protein
MKYLLLSCLGLLCLAGVPQQVAAQSSSGCDSIAFRCETDLFPFNSDGNYYRAELFPGETAKLTINFSSDLVYRIVPCGTSDEGVAPEFSIVDPNGVGVFFSDKAPAEGTYDIGFGASGEYTIEVRYPEGGGCAALLVGYLTEQEAEEYEAFINQ